MSERSKNYGSKRAAEERLRFRLRACTRCGGDAFLDLLDESEWRCLQCARPVAAELEPRPRIEAQPGHRAAAAAPAG